MKERYSEAAIVYFSPDHRFILLYGTVIQGPTSEAISGGDGRVVYFGTWKLIGNSLHVEYRLVSRTIAKEGETLPGPVQTENIRAGARTLFFQKDRFKRDEKLDGDDEFKIALERDREHPVITDAETLTVCKLLANTRTYVGQTVTVNATLVANFEFSALTDGSCAPKPAEIDGKHPVIQPHWDTHSYDPKSPTAKRLNKLLKKEYQARVTLVGIFVDPGQYFGHQLCCRYRLDVSKLVSVEKLTVER